MVANDNLNLNLNLKSGGIVMWMDLLMILKSLDTQHSRSMIMHLTIQWNIMPMNTWTIKSDMIMQWLSVCQMTVPLPHVLQWFWGLYKITSHWVFLHPNFTGEDELSFNTIQENMAVDNNLYVVVHTASDYVSSDQLVKEFVSPFILGDVMSCV